MRTVIILTVLFALGCMPMGAQPSAISGIGYNNGLVTGQPFSANGGITYTYGAGVPTGRSYYSGSRYDATTFAGQLAGTGSPTETTSQTSDDGADADGNRPVPQTGEVPPPPPPSAPTVRPSPIRHRESEAIAVRRRAIAAYRVQLTADPGNPELRQRIALLEEQIQRMQ